jgi:hypothetical protein
MNIKLLIPQNKAETKAVALNAGRAIERAADKITCGLLDTLADAVVTALETRVTELTKEESHGK